MTQDPISDFFIRIKNAYLSKKDKVAIPYSKTKHALSNVLNRTGFVGKVEVNEKTAQKNLFLTLLYPEKQAKLTDLAMVSKPGRRVYVNKTKVPKVLGGMGIAVISTPLGIMSDKEARNKGIGGELICKIW